MNFSKDIDASKRFIGFSNDYDTYRLTPPKEIFQIAYNLNNQKKFGLVVDVGSGTGLSTRPWAAIADEVIGIEPSLDMIMVAKRNISDKNVLFKQGYGNNTGLQENSVDLIAMSSALHWMEPHSTIKELKRIMTNNGIICSYGHYYPFYADSKELTKAHEVWRNNLDHLEYTQEQQKVELYNVNETIKLMTNNFAYIRKIYLHAQECWTKDQILGFMRAHAGVQFLKEKGYSDSDLKFDYFEDVMAKHSKLYQFNVYFTYSVFFIFN